MKTNANQHTTGLQTVDNREAGCGQPTTNAVMHTLCTTNSQVAASLIDNRADLPYEFNRLGRLAFHHGQGIVACPLDNLTLSEQGTACRKAWLDGWQAAARIKTAREDKRAPKGAEARKQVRLMRLRQQPLPPAAA